MTFQSLVPYGFFLDLETLKLAVGNICKCPKSHDDGIRDLYILSIESFVLEVVLFLKFVQRLE